MSATGAAPAQPVLILQELSSHKIQTPSQGPVHSCLSLLSYLNPSPSSHYFLSILASFLFFEPVKLFAIWRSLHLLFPGPGVFFCRAGSATFRAQFQWHFLTEAFPIQILLHFILFIHSTYHLPLSYPFLLSSSPTKLLDAYGQETYLFTTVSKSLA